MRNEPDLGRALCALGGLLPLVAGCVAPTAATVEPTPLVVTLDLPLTRPPYREVHADWKQRLAQRYVYVEHRGSYTETGRLLPEVTRVMAAQGLEPAGPPFALFYDDPGRVPVSQLRSRACVPVAGSRAPAAPLAADVLPSTTVAYAFVAGPYPELPRAYPGLYAFLQRMHWVENGPMREIYLVAPDSVTSFDELVAEVQLPATAAR